MKEIDILVLKANLKKYRKLAGMNQLQAAELIGVTRQSIHNWEKNPNKMSYERLHQLAEIYKVTVNDFFMV